MVRTLLHRRPFVAMEKVTAPLLAADRKVTEWNSLPARAAKVIVCDVVELKTTVPVPDHPVVLSEDIAAFRSTVTVPPPEFASKNTGLEAFGTEQPFTPPDEEDQCVVCDQLPVPPIQYRLPGPQGAERVTSTTGSEASMVKTT